MAKARGSGGSFHFGDDLFGFFDDAIRSNPAWSSAFGASSGIHYTAADPELERRDEERRKFQRMRRRWQAMTRRWGERRVRAEAERIFGPQIRRQLIEDTVKRSGRPLERLVWIVDYDGGLVTP